MLCSLCREFYNVLISKRLRYGRAILDVPLFAVLIRAAAASLNPSSSLPIEPSAMGFVGQIDLNLPRSLYEHSKKWNIELFPSTLQMFVGRTTNPEFCKHLCKIRQRENICV